MITRPTYQSGKLLDNLDVITGWNINIYVKIDVLVTQGRIFQTCIQMTFSIFLEVEIIKIFTESSTLFS